jgi:serine/threonine protein kinase
MASAIAYLHSLDIVHRDIKAESFLLTSKDSKWDIKLTDFGSAKELENVTNSFVGTKGYISPEILQRNNLTKISDEDRTMSFTDDETDFNEA